jgi:TolB protein
MRPKFPLTLLLFAAISNPALADVPQRQLLFTSNRTGDSEIFLINEDGTNAKNLTNNPADDAAPAWSPDGKKIAFQSNREGAIALYVMDADGGNVKRLTSDAVFDCLPAWSPDGTKIAWVRSLRPGNNEIFVMAADGTGQRNLSNRPGRDNNPAWSPDGRYIAFTSGPLTDRALCVMNAEGNDRRTLMINSVESYPAFSPDGKTIAYTTFGSAKDNYEIYACDVDGNNPRQLTNLGSMNSLPSWSPDGKQITFQHHEILQSQLSVLPPADLYMMDADGSNPRVIVSGEAHTRVRNTPFGGGRPAWKPK